MVWKLYISDNARHEIQDIWYRGLSDFGLQIADDYELLIQQALLDLLENPLRQGAAPYKSSKDSLHEYRLTHSNARASGNIKHPSHAIYYYLIEDHIVAIAGICRQEREQHISSLSREEILRELENDMD